MSSQEKVLMPAPCCFNSFAAHMLRVVFGAFDLPVGRWVFHSDYPSVMRKGAHQEQRSNGFTIPFYNRSESRL